MPIIFSSLDDKGSSSSSPTPTPTPPPDYPCDNNGFPAGTCLDKYYIDLNARYDQAGQDCPAICREPGDCDCTYPCDNNGFPAGTCLDKHYIDTNARYNQAGQSCPAICRTPGDCDCGQSSSSSGYADFIGRSTNTVFKTY